MCPPGDPEFIGDCLFKQLEAEGFVCSLPARAILFMEHDAPRGVHVIGKGHVKFTVGSRGGRVLIVGIVGAGEILGLHNCISGATYEMTAQTLQPSRVGFVKREDLLRMLQSNPEVCLSATRRLSKTCHEAYTQVGYINFSQSASEKLARFLLTLSAENGSAKAGADERRVEMDLTHDEIAQVIGASRETVTRALAAFRNKQLANLTRSTLLVKNRAELEKIAGLDPSWNGSRSDSGKRDLLAAVRPARLPAAWASGRQAS
jgi:CRP/FNR family transcriptional regulator, cyclic AMP receptor protein